MAKPKIVLHDLTDVKNPIDREVEMPAVGCVLVILPGTVRGSRKELQLTEVDGHLEILAREGKPVITPRSGNVITVDVAEQ